MSLQNKAKIIDALKDGLYKREKKKKKKSVCLRANKDGLQKRAKIINALKEGGIACMCISSEKYKSSRSELWLGFFHFPLSVEF